MQVQLNTDSLYAVGFRHAATWIVAGQFLAYEFNEQAEKELRPLFEVSNALYAFCRNESVLYIGKTTQSLRRRLAGYCRPAQTQATNLRCHTKIKEMLANSEKISILVFTPINQLQYAGFDINLAAGLEDSLIRQFLPPWNGTRQGRAITESAEIEIAEEQMPPEAEGTRQPDIGRFEVQLGITYYNQGIINPGKAASSLLGEHDETLVVRFNDGNPSITTRIDRRANRTGAVRFVGSNHLIADWFQRNFHIGDLVPVRILGSNEVEFIKPNGGEHEKIASR